MEIMTTTWAFEKKQLRQCLITSKSVLCLIWPGDTQNPEWLDIVMSGLQIQRKYLNIAQL